jgi:nucleoside-diphosphate-sugar epimerase
LISAGHEVVGIDRRGTSLDPRVAVVAVDVSSGEGLTDVVAGADAVVHLAARNHVLRETAKDPLTEYRRVNICGSRNMAREAARAGVKMFIHMSSVKAMGESSDRVLDEQAVCVPRTDYGISKLESEQAVREEAERGGMAAVILRLPMVYGPRDRGNLPRMIRWADRGLPFPLAQPDNLRSMVYVENVVTGILAILGLPLQGVDTYLLKDREDYSTRSLYGSICHALRKRPRFLPIPAWVVGVGGRLSEDFGKITRSFRISSAKIEKELGFRPPVSMEEGIERTVKWYLDSAR